MAVTKIWPVRDRFDKVLAYRQHAMDEIDRFIRERQDARNAIKRAQRSGDTTLYSHAKYNVQVLTRRLAKLHHWCRIKSVGIRHKEILQQCCRIIAGMKNREAR